MMPCRGDLLDPELACRTSTLLSLTGFISIVSCLVQLCQGMSQPTEIYLARGLEGRVECPAEADPPLTLILWRKNFTIMDPSEDIHRVSVDKYGTLIFENVTYDDAGLYTCTPYSPMDDKYSTIAITIKVKDVPSFIVRPRPIYQVPAGDNVVMPCVVKGDPEPTLIWKRVDGWFPPSTRTLQDGGNLTIAFLSREDQGIYECIAINDVTTIITTTLLIVFQGVAHSAPYNVTVVDVTENSAKINWLPPYVKEGQQYNYELRCQTVGSVEHDWQIFRSIPDNATSVTIYNLQPKTMYKFKVLSNHSGRIHDSRDVLVTTKDVPNVIEINGHEDDEISGEEDGSGVISSPVSIEPVIRPLAPVNVVVRQEKNGVRVTWTPPKNTLVPIVSYVVEYQTVGNWVPLSDNLTHASFFWKTASLGTSYNFRVISYGKVSSSGPSQVTKFHAVDPMSGVDQSSGSAALGGLIAGLVLASVASFAIAGLVLRFHQQRRNKRRERSSHAEHSEYACSTSISRTLEGRESPILDSLAIVSNHTPSRNHEVRHIQETPI